MCSAVRFRAPRFSFAAVLSCLVLPLAADPGSATSSTRAWADFDGDGRVDLYLLAPGGEDALLWNDGKGELVDITKSTGLAGRRSRSVLAFDFDGDAHPDLLLTDQAGALRLFRGLGNAAFEDVSAGLGFDLLPPVASASWGDVDADGFPDLEIDLAGGGVRLLRSDGGRSFRPPVVHERLVSAGSSTTIVGSPRGGTRALDDPAVAACADTIRDVSTGQCIEVSSWPELGNLLPLSPSLFVDIFGRVGIGTTVPSAQLEVAGTAEIDGDLRFNGSTDGILFSNSSSSPSPMVTMFPPGGQSERMVLSESAAISERGLKYTPLIKQFAFQESDVDPVLRVDLDSGQVQIGGASVLPHDLVIGDTGDATIYLEADTDNNIESHQPAIWFSQDGDIVRGRLGMFDSANDLVLEHTYPSADIFFRVRDEGTGSTRREFEWHNTDGINSDVEMRLTANGNLQIDGTYSSPAADVAEYYSVVEPVEPGDVVVFAGEGLGLGLADAQNAARLAGVVSSRPAVTLGLSYTEESPSDLPVFEGDDARLEGAGKYAVDLGVRHEITANGRAPLALTGRVPVKVTTENGPIRAGDLLGVSTIPGRAARVVAAGPVIGTALESFEGGEGVVLVLANLGWYAPDAQGELQALENRLATLERRLSALVASEER